ncbi:MAG: hypothetical protein ABJC09_02895 [Terriglobia bacterium]
MKKILAVFLVIQFSSPLCVFAQQQPASVEPPPTMMASSLRILALEGQGATNKIDSHQGTAPIVEVRDENDKPVEGATVVFRLPPSGPGGTFAGGAVSKTMRTNVQGQAIAAGLTPNDVAGPFKIHVTATAGNKIGETDIDQSNSNKLFAARPAAPSRFRFSKKMKLVAIGAAAGVVLAVILITTSGSGSAPPTITITPGPVSIGGR